VGQLKQCNYAHFPTLSASQPNEATIYIAFVGQLREQFKTGFADLNNQAFALFATLFAVTVDIVVVRLQLELVDLQCQTDLKTRVY